jgi:hypothetical protein
MFLYLIEDQRVLKEDFANISSDQSHEGRVRK